MAAGVLLAAGESRRMGAGSKLLLPAGPDTVVRRAAQALLDAGLSPVVAVLGCRATEVTQALDGLPLHLVTNPRFADGMGTSLATGVAALPRSARRAVVALGDMPAVLPETICALLSACGEQGIAAPVYRGRRGHPVLFDLPTYRDRLETLDGDRGARALLDTHPQDVLRVPVDDIGVVLDLDTPEQYQEWLRNRSQ